MKKMTAPIILFSILIIALVALYRPYKEELEKHDPVEQAEIKQPSSYIHLQRLLTIEDMTEKTRQLNIFFMEHMQNNPLETLTIISHLKKIHERQLCYDLALAIWFNQDTTALSLWLKNERPREDLDPALNSLLLVSSQLKDSLIFSDKIFDFAVRERELTRLFNQWISDDTEQIIRWSIEEYSNTDIWLTLAFKLLSKESHTKAIKSLSYLTIENMTQVRLALQTMIDNYQFGIIDNHALLALQTLEPYKLREEAILALLPLLTNEKHLSLADMTTTLNSLLPGELRDELHELLALNWANKNPTEAGQFAQSLTGDIRARALSAVVATWAKKDLEAADEWLKNVDGDLDLAASTIGREAAKLGNVQISDEWLDDIMEEELRVAAITEAIQSYYKESPESGIYHLVYQKNLTTQKKLELLHEIYPNEHFISPNQALDEIGRLEGLSRGY